MIKITKKKRYENPLMKKKNTSLIDFSGGFTKDEYNAILTFGT